MLLSQPAWFPSCFSMFFAQIRSFPNAVKVGVLQQLLTGLPLCRVHTKATLRKKMK